MQMLISAVIFARNAALIGEMAVLITHIALWLEQLATDRQFEVDRILVKSQKVRWASHSKRKTLSLNAKMLFLPPELVRYVLIHELCHNSPS